MGESVRCEASTAAGAPASVGVSVGMAAEAHESGVVAGGSLVAPLGRKFEAPPVLLSAHVTQQ